MATAVKIANASQLPLAEDDYFTLAMDEDGGGSGSTDSLLANDQGGNAKTFYGLGGGGATTTSAKGATLSLAGEEIYYNPGTLFDYLAEGESTTDTFTYTIQLGNGALATATVTVFINGNNDVVLVRDVFGETGENGAPITLSADYSDVDGNDTHIFSIDTSGLKGIAIHNGDGTFSYNTNGQFEHLAAGEFATDTFTYTVDDGNGGAATKKVTITVTGENDAPVAQDMSEFADENTPITRAFAADDVDSDDDQSSLAYSLVSAPTRGGVSINADGTFTFDPGTAFDGLDDGESATVSFIYKANDGTADSEAKTVTILIGGRNDAPVASSGQVAGTEDTTITGSVIATDVDGETLSYQLVQGAKDHGGNPVAGLTLDEDGSYSFHPPADFYGTVTFSFRAFDGTQYSSVETVTLNVNAVDDAPTAMPDVALGREDTATNIDVLANDTDPDGGQKSIASLGPATNGTVALNNDGTIRYTPNSNFNGFDSFTYTLSGGSETTVQVFVRSVNDAPVNAFPTGLQTVAEDKSLTFSVTNGNAISVSDIDAPVGKVVTFDLATGQGTITLGSTAGLTFEQGANGSNVIRVAGTIENINAALNGMTFTPYPDFNGEAYISLVSNDQGDANGNNNLVDIDNNAIRILVTPVNDAPVNSYPTAIQTMHEDGALVFSTANGNAISMSDVDAPAGKVVTFQLLTGQGIITLSGTAGLTFEQGGPNGSNFIRVAGTIADINAALEGMTFTPYADFNGEAFISLVSDDRGDTLTSGNNNRVDIDNSAVRISVLDVPEAPAITTLSAAASGMLQDMTYRDGSYAHYSGFNPDEDLDAMYNATSPDQVFNSTSLSVYDARDTVKDSGVHWFYKFNYDYDYAYTAEWQGVLEFDVSNIDGPVTDATFKFDPDWVSDTPETFYFYINAGDGVVSSGDWDSGALLGSLTLSNADGATVYEVDLNEAAINAALDQGAEYLTLTIRSDGLPDDGAVNLVSGMGFQSSSAKLDLIV